jgi:hypothetical protein
MDYVAQSVMVSGEDESQYAKCSAQKNQRPRRAHCGCRSHMGCCPPHPATWWAAPSRDDSVALDCAEMRGRFLWLQPMRFGRELAMGKCRSNICRRLGSTSFDRAKIGH